MTGVLLVDKPEGITSAGVIRRLKGALGRAKVGHVGTLDPFASGLLPLCIGEATKIAGHLLLERKVYEGRICLGRATDTLDGTGAVVETAAVPMLTAENVARVAQRFTGRQLQVPPMYSALKRDGVPLYRLAREGIEVERVPREIDIERLRLEIAGVDALDFEVACSKGTYVRVLAADIGAALGTVAHLGRLRRTQVGRFVVRDAVSPDVLRDRPAPEWPLVSIGDALCELPRLVLESREVQSLRRGQQGALGRFPAGDPGSTGLVVGRDGEIVGLVGMGEALPGWRVLRLLAP